MGAACSISSAPCSTARSIAATTSQTRLLAPGLWPLLRSDIMLTLFANFREMNGFGELHCGLIDVHFLEGKLVRRVHGGLLAKEKASVNPSPWVRQRPEKMLDRAHHDVLRIQGFHLHPWNTFPCSWKGRLRCAYPDPNLLQPCLQRSRFRWRTRFLGASHWCCCCGSCIACVPNRTRLRNHGRTPRVIKLMRLPLTIPVDPSRSRPKIHSRALLLLLVRGDDREWLRVPAAWAHRETTRASSTGVAVTAAR